MKKRAIRYYGLVLILCVMALAAPVVFAEDASDGGAAGITAAQTDRDLELKACGTTDVKFSAKTDKKQHPLAEPQAGMAIVYVLRPTMMGNKVQTKLAMDGNWLGVNRGKNYFYFIAEPGEHNFCSKAENSSILTMTLEPDKTYFLQQKIQMGLMKARTSLVAMTEEEGQDKLADCHLSIFEEKR